MKSKCSFRLLATTTLVMAFSASSLANAASISWNGADSTIWATPTNWTGGIAPTATDTAVFNLASYSNQPNAGTTSVGGLQIGDGTTVTGALTLSGTSLTLGTSGISMLANAGGATISTPLVFGGAQSWANTSGNTLTIDGAVTRNVGAAVNFVPTGTINLAVGSGLANTNGILGGWATVGNSGGSGATADWAAVDGGGNVVPYAGYTDVASGNQTGAGASAENWRTVNTGIQTNLTASATINSLVVRSDFSVSSGNTMTLGSGGLILSGISRWFKGPNGNSSDTGQITSGLASGELFVDVASSTANASDWRIWTKLVDNGGTAVSLVKTGPGDVGLLNTNTYTGGTYLDSGTLSLVNSGSLGSGDLRMNGGALNIRYAGANVDLANNIVVSGTSSNIYLGVARNLGLNGTISGSGALTLGNNNQNSTIYLSGANTMTSGTITLANNTNSVRFANTLAGNANVAWVLNNATANRNTMDFATGTLSFGSMTGTGIFQSNGAGAKTISVGALNLSDTFSGQIANGSGTVSVNKVGTGTWTLSGANSFTGETVVTGGTLQIGNGTTGSIAAGSAITVGASGTLALNLAASTFSNAITNEGAVSAISNNAITLSGGISGAGSLLKSGAGTLTLSGFNPYTGPTTISAGKLNVLFSGSIESSAVTLGAATLGGNGFVGGVTANNAGAIISNGNSNTDTLTLSSLTFSAAGALNLNKLNDTFTPAVIVTNTLAIGSGFTVNLSTAPSWITGETYNLIGYGSLSGTASNIVKGAVPGLGARQIATIGNTGPTDGYITLSITGDTPVWTGLQSNAWTTADVGGAYNWELLGNGTNTNFVTNDQVIFDDTAGGTTNVNIPAANVQVASVVFNNNDKDYTLSSTGGFGIADGASSASLAKSGYGSLTLKTLNSFTGAVVITDGTLQLGDGTTDGDIASSSGITNDATLVYNRTGGSFSYAGAISGFGSVVKNGAGTQIFSGASSYSGTTTITAGTVQVGSGGTSGALGSGTVTNDGSLVFNRSNAVAQGTDFGLIEGVGPVTQAGAGTLTLSFGNTYGGGTSINSGTILVGTNDPLGSGSVTLAGGALGSSGSYSLSNALIAQASTTSVFATAGSNLTLNGNLTGSGNINRIATGNPASIYLGGDNSGFSGTFTVEANGSAATRINSANSGSQNAKWVINQPVSTRASLDFAGGTIQFGSLTGTGFFTSQGAGINTIEVGNLGLDETFSGVLNQGAGSTLAVTKVGAGIWTLTGTNTYTGDTIVNAGVLAVDGDAIANANKLVINGGKVDPTGATEVVDTLYFGATQQAAGTWGATGSGATHIDDTHFTGTGMVSVTTGAAAGFSSWADANGASGQTMDEDHDGDGVDNGVEYFMGETGSSFTTNPAPVSGTVTWPMGATFTGVYGTDYEIQTSGDLASWTQVPVGAGAGVLTVTPGVSVAYTLPAGGGKVFVRLVVTP
jgi:fibronectin-binding autotransporter adhesin